MERIIEYINQKYKPLSIILYGSYANGTNNRSSDFDALVIADGCEQFHDTSFVNGVRLDVFIYPASYFEEGYDCRDFVQIFDGKIISDRDGRGKALKANVLSYLKNRPQKSKAEIDNGVDWCVKMLARARRCDAEGMFRLHWVLIDSLEIFCDVMHHDYFGPKKALKWMEENCPAAFACYKEALADSRLETLENWITYIENSRKSI